MLINIRDSCSLGRDIDVSVLKYHIVHASCHTEQFDCYNPQLTIRLLQNLFLTTFLLQIHVQQCMPCLVGIFYSKVFKCCSEVAHSSSVHRSSSFLSVRFMLLFVVRVKCQIELFQCLTTELIVGSKTKGKIWRILRLSFSKFVPCRSAERLCSCTSLGFIHV